MNPVLEARGLRYSYPGGVEALRGVSMEAPRGVLTCVLGPNGAGKTTLLRILAGVLRPSGGEVLVDGVPLHRLGRREAARLIGYVPQSTSTPFAYRVADYIAMGRAPYLGLFGAPGRRDWEAVRRAAEALGIEGLLERSLSELSGGQERLAAIARALAQEPRILVLDEPAAHLDVANKARVMETVLSLLRRGAVEAAVATMHDPLLASLYCGHVVLLSSGRAVAEGPPGEALEPGLLEEVYGVGFRLVDVDGSRLVVPAPSRGATSCAP